MSYELRKGQQCMHARIAAGLRLRDAAKLLEVPPWELSGVEWGRIAVDADRYDEINGVYRRHVAARTPPAANETRKP